MTGIDTNVLVRFFTKDDPDQTLRAKKFLRTLTMQEPGFVSLICLIELVWVLRSQYDFDKKQLIQRLEQLIDSREIVLESQSAVEQSLRKFAGAKVDFADCLIERCGHAFGCRHTVTFDFGAAKATGMQQL